MNNPVIEYTNLLHKHEDIDHPEVMAFKNRHKNDMSFLERVWVIELAMFARWMNKSKPVSLWRRIRWYFNFPAKKDLTNLDIAFVYVSDLIDRWGWNSDPVQIALNNHANQPYGRYLRKLSKRYAQPHLAR